MFLALPEALLFIPLWHGLGARHADFDEARRCEVVAVVSNLLDSPAVVSDDSCCSCRLASANRNTETIRSAEHSPAGWSSMIADFRSTSISGVQLFDVAASTYSGAAMRMMQSPGVPRL